MAKVNELNLKSVKMADGSDVYIAVLFTLSDEYLEDVSEKKQNRYWGTFSKNMVEIYQRRTTMCLQILIIYQKRMITLIKR